MLENIIKLFVTIIFYSMTIFLNLLGIGMIVIIFVGEMKDYEYFLAFLTLIYVGIHDLILHDLSIEDVY